MSNIDKLQKLIPLSESNEYQVSDYTNVLMSLSSNTEIEELESYREILESSIGGDSAEFGVILNSIREHLETSFEINEFRVRRRTVRQKTRRRDPRRSRIAKMSWRKNKSRMKRGLKRFHRSSKGKAFHKALGKFVSRNKSKREMTEAEHIVDVVNEMHEFRISINSALTHMLIDYKNSPEDYMDLDADDFDDLFEVVSESLKESQEALDSNDSEIIEDTLNELIAEVGSVFLGIDMEFLYDEVLEEE